MPLKLHELNVLELNLSSLSQKIHKGQKRERSILVGKVNLIVVLFNILFKYTRKNPLLFGYSTWIDRGKKI